MTRTTATSRFRIVGIFMISAVLVTACQPEESSVAENSCTPDEIAALRTYHEIVHDFMRTFEVGIGVPGQRIKAAIVMMDDFGLFRLDLSIHPTDCAREYAERVLEAMHVVNQALLEPDGTWRYTEAKAEQPMTPTPEERLIFDPAWVLIRDLHNEHHILMQAHGADPHKRQ